MAFIAAYNALLAATNSLAERFGVEPAESLTGVRGERLLFMGVHFSTLTSEDDIALVTRMHYFLEDGGEEVVDPSPAFITRFGEALYNNMRELY